MTGERTALIASLAAVAAAIAVACGAGTAEAPAAVPRTQGGQCQSFDQLMPNLVQSIRQGRLTNLRQVMECDLLADDGDPLTDDVPPINDVLRVQFATMLKFARAPREPGAGPGLLCAPDDDPPPLSSANQLCEMRRASYTLVHQGKGLASIALIDPQVTGLLNYIIGRSNRRELEDGGVVGDRVPVKPHYEIATIVSGMCSQDGQCQLENGLDLVTAVVAYLETREGKKLIDDLKVALRNPRLRQLVSASDPQALTEEQMVAGARVLLPALQNADEAQLRSLLDLPVLRDYRADLQPLIDDVAPLLAPGHTPDVRTPLNKSLACVVAKDPNYELVRMVHRLALQDRLPEFGFTALSGTAIDAQDIDPRGALLHLVGTLAAAVRSDEAAVDSAGRVCRALFSTRPSVGNVRSNAELVLPVMADLFSRGVANEAVCALDVLVWGCTNGGQPACPNGAVALPFTATVSRDAGDDFVCPKR